MNRIKFTEEQMLVVESVSKDNYEKGVVCGIVIGMAVSAAITISLMLASHYEFLFF
tara:strand:- start:118 stop:285 length:168 start_codon:yes stop_codon:yes gene_type:complete